MNTEYCPTCKGVCHTLVHVQNAGLSQTFQWEFECTKGHRMVHTSTVAPETLICLGDYCDLPMRCTGPWRDGSSVYLENDVISVGEIA